VNKLFGYPGGKWPIRHIVVSCFPEHETYVDVFGGSAAILISKDPSKGEVFNDKNEELVNFFRVVKHRPAELAERARHWLHSRKLWYELRAAASMDEVERAFRFWALLADSFGGRGETFGTTRSGVRSVTKAREYLDAVANRLKNVHVECLDFQKCIKMYDAPQTFFYLDPPYRGTAGGNTNYDLLSDEEWKTLRDMLGSLQGKFLLSSNADSFVVRLFKGFSLHKLDVRVTLPRNKEGQTRRELLIADFEIPWSRSRGKRTRVRRAGLVADRAHAQIEVALPAPKKTLQTAREE